jgi:GH15 family glucan-1,4-alpha-glucosidase
VSLVIRAKYGRGRMADLKRQGETWTGRSGGTWFRWSGASRAQTADGVLGMRIELAEGAKHDLVLEISDREFTDEPPDTERCWAATEETWSGVAPDCEDLIAVCDARHAYAVLHGLTSASGATVAAATTSLPERLEGARNYDYRYAWVRDQCYTGLAVAEHGPHPAARGRRPVRRRAAARRRARADARLHGRRRANR